MNQVNKTSLVPTIRIACLTGTLFFGLLWLVSMYFILTKDTTDRPAHPALFYFFTMVFPLLVMAICAGILFFVRYQWDETGIYKHGLFSKTAIPWDEISSIHADPSSGLKLSIYGRDGQHIKIDFTNVAPNGFYETIFDRARRLSPMSATDRSGDDFISVNKDGIYSQVDSKKHRTKFSQVDYVFKNAQHEFYLRNGETHTVISLENNSVVHVDSSSANYGWMTRLLRAYLQHAVWIDTTEPAPADPRSAYLYHLWWVVKSRADLKMDLLLTGICLFLIASYVGLDMFFRHRHHIDFSHNAVSSSGVLLIVLVPVSMHLYKWLGSRLALPALEHTLGDEATDLEPIVTDFAFEKD